MKQERESEIRNRLLAVRKELLTRLRSTQRSERREVESKSNDEAQLWEVSEIRDDLDGEVAGQLAQVDEALARLEAGEYGSCGSCGKTIGAKRLEALPYATLCVRCADRLPDS